MNTVESGLFIAGVYLAIGLVIGLVFALFLTPRIDHSASGASFPFKITVLPGMALLWPILLVFLVSGRRVNRNIHDEQANS